MTTVSHRRVSGLQRGRAKALRRDMTDAERKLWAALRGHRFHGLAFRRQSPIGPFIVDFVCQRLRLVIEVDGGQHATTTLQDIQRAAWLTSKGYRILHFWNSDVLRNMEGVLQTIMDAASNCSPPTLTFAIEEGGDEAADTQRTAAKSNTPLPNPPPQGAIVFTHLARPLLQETKRRVISISAARPKPSARSASRIN